MKDTINMSNDRLRAMIFTFLLLMITFANSSIVIARVTLYVFFVATIVYVPIMTKRFAIIHMKITKSILLLVLYIVLTLFLNLNGISSVYNALLYCATLLFVLVLINRKQSNKYINLQIKYLSFIGKILFIFKIILLIIDIDFIWVSSTSFLFLFLYFIFLNYKTKSITKIIFTLLWLLFVIVDNERTFILLFPVILLMFPIWNSIIKSSIKYKSFIYFVVATVLAIPIIYVLLSVSEYRSTLDYYAIKFTTSRFFSGRDVIWSAMLNDYLERSFIFGGGHHLSPGVVAGIDNSSHNTYITILTRTGALGVILFFNFLKEIWFGYYKHKNSIAIKYSAIFFVIIILKQSSEYSLIGNNMALSVFSWIVMIYGLIYTSAFESKCID